MGSLPVYDQHVQTGIVLQLSLDLKEQRTVSQDYARVTLILIRFESELVELVCIVGGRRVFTD